MAGFIKLHRKLKDWEYADRPHYLAAFIHLLLRANFEDTVYKGVTIRAGELACGRHLLAKWTCLKDSQCRTILTALESARIITRRKEGRIPIISITKWSDYQHQKPESCHENNLKVATKTPRKQPHLKKKEIKNKEERNNILSDFETFWSEYPKKQAKPTAKKAFEKAIKNGASLTLLLESLRIHSKTEQWQNKQYIPMASTWLNQERFNDELEPVKSRLEHDEDLINFFEEKLNGI